MKQRLEKQDDAIKELNENKQTMRKLIQDLSIVKVVEPE